MSESYNNIINEMIAFIKRHEGGYAAPVLLSSGTWTNATMKGIELPTFRKYYPNATVNDLKNITDAQWRRVFEGGFLNPVENFYDNDEKYIMQILFLLSWTWGSGFGNTWFLQKTLNKEYNKNVSVDGQLGQETANACKTLTFKQLCDIRRNYFKYLMQNPDYSMNVGWLIRIDNFYNEFKKYEPVTNKLKKKN